MSIESNIIEFRKAFRLPVNLHPKLLSEDDMDLHFKLIHEELKELTLAYYEGDIVEVFDGIVDLIYVTAGLAVHTGLPLDAGWREVHASNMSKLDENGEPIYREDGKVLKSDKFKEPRLDVLIEQEWSKNENTD